MTLKPVNLDEPREVDVRKGEMADRWRHTGEELVTSLTYSRKGIRFFPKIAQEVGHGLENGKMWGLFILKIYLNRQKIKRAQLWFSSGKAKYS